MLFHFDMALQMPFTSTFHVSFFLYVHMSHILTDQTTNQSFRWKKMTQDKSKQFQIRIRLKVSVEIGNIHIYVW